VNVIAEPFVFVFIAFADGAETRRFSRKEGLFPVSNAILMLAYFALYFLSAVEIAMMVRAILSFLMPDGQGAFIGFLYAITEPLISVVRRVFDRFGWESRGIFDIPFFATYFLIMILKAVFRAML
jgi:uncharacterized protein YggT (Ycf19 family)